MEQGLQDPDFANDTWRIFRIMAEFVEGFESLSRIPKGVTVFGSARSKPGEEDYRRAEEVGRALAGAGHAVITGGGPGDMEAANKGALEAGVSPSGSRSSCLSRTSPTPTSRPPSRSATSSCARSCS